jgi:uncharacterized protein (TIGR02117 family)
MQSVIHNGNVTWFKPFGNWLQLKLFRINTRWRILRALFAWPMLAIGMFMLAALIGSFVPANNGWTAPRGGIPIFVETNGVHVSIIVPMTAAGEDLSDFIRPEDLNDPSLYGTHFMIGWGHKAVYRNAKTWADVRSGDVASAVFGSDETTMHVYHLINPQPASYRKQFNVRPGEYRKIIAQIRASFQTGAQGHTAAYPAYGPNNIFYDANGHYSAVNTCNNWTGRVLRDAGIRVGVWTPMPGGIMRWF